MGETIKITNASLNDTSLTADFTWFSLGGGYDARTLEFNPVGKTLIITYLSSLDNEYHNYYADVSINSSNLSFIDRNNSYNFIKMPDIYTGIESINESILPISYHLSQNYPNPFNPFTVIEFIIPKESDVTLKVYDILGREIETLVDKRLSQGSYKAIFKDNGYASGIYFYRLISGKFADVKSMTLIK